MSYYNPYKWIADDDLLINEIESRLKMQKQARSTTYSSKRGQFLPPVGLEFIVLVEQSGDKLRMVEWTDNEGKIYIDLRSLNTYLRKGHYNQPHYHHNPDGRNIRPPHHIHFPTHKHPDLTTPHTYAHPTSNVNGYLDALKEFCGRVNIQIISVKIPF